MTTNDLREDFPSHEPLSKKDIKYPPMSSVLKHHKEDLLKIAVGVLVYKNLKLKSSNRRLTRQIREVSKYVRDARIELEALNVFDRYFGPAKSAKSASNAANRLSKLN